MFFRNCCGFARCCGCNRCGCDKREDKCDKRDDKENCEFNRQEKCCPKFENKCENNKDRYEDKCCCKFEGKYCWIKENQDRPAEKPNCNKPFDDKCCDCCKRCVKENDYNDFDNKSSFRDNKYNNETFESDRNYFCNNPFNYRDR